MFDAISQSEPPRPLRADEPVRPLQRTQGRLRVTLEPGTGRARAAELYQQGAMKARLPRVHDGAMGEVVLLNTAGGLTGGDRLDVAVRARPGVAAVVTTQASEKVYRARDGVAEVASRLDIAAGARLEWLPQETILFNRGRLRRSLEVHLAGDAGLLALEPVVLGRTAMGERVEEGLFADAWRVWRDGAVLYADALRLEDDIARRLAGRATLAGWRGFASGLLVDVDAGARLDALRDAFAEIEAAMPVLAGASLVNGNLVFRIAAADGSGLRAAAIAALHVLRAGAPLPRVWSL
jgi:urease accessory protein